MYVYLFSDMLTSLVTFFENRSVAPLPGQSLEYAYDLTLIMQHIAKSGTYQES